MTLNADPVKRVNIFHIFSHVILPFRDICEFCSRSRSLSLLNVNALVKSQNNEMCLSSYQCVIQYSSNIWLTKGRENGGAPHQFAENTWNENEAAHLRAEFVLEWVQHRDVLALAELLGEKDTAEEETEGVSEGSLAPDESLGEGFLGRRVDVTSADPSCCWMEEQMAVSARY